MAGRRDPRAVLRGRIPTAVRIGQLSDLLFAIGWTGVAGYAWSIHASGVFVILAFGMAAFFCFLAVMLASGREAARKGQQAVSAIHLMVGLVSIEAGFPYALTIGLGQAGMSLLMLLLMSRPEVLRFFGRHDLLAEAEDIAREFE